MAIEASIRIKAFVEGLNQVQSSFNKLGKNLTSVGKSLTLGLTTPIAAFGVAGVAAFDKQAKAIAQVEAGLKSTANAAGLTSGELQSLASGLQENSLFGDEAILQDVTAQLLSFTNIAGSQFAKTQQAALDLSARLGGDLKSASIQLGKALNDPTANLSALSRSGIQFSKEQVTVIKGLQSTNRLAEAQTLILKELENQYGGSAKAAAEAGLGPLTQLKNVIGDLSEEFGAIIAEAILPFIKSIKGFVTSFKNLSPEVKRVTVIFVGLIAALGPALILLGKMSIGIGALIGLFAKLNIVANLSKITLRGVFAATGVGLLIVAVGFLANKFFDLKEELGSIDRVFDFVKLNILKGLQTLNLGFTTLTNSLRNGIRKLFGKKPDTKATDSIKKEIDEIDGKITDLRNKAKAEKILEDIAANRDPDNTLTTPQAPQFDDSNLDLTFTPEVKIKKVKITPDQLFELDNTAILAGIEEVSLANRNALAEAQINGASEEDQNQLRIENLRRLIGQLQIAKEARMQFNQSGFEPRVREEVVKLNEQLARAKNELQKLNEIPLTPLEESIKSLNTELNSSPEAATQVNNAFTSFVSQANRGIENLTSTGLNGLTTALEGVINGTKSAGDAFKDFADQIVKQLIRIAIQKAITAAINSVGPAGSTGTTGVTAASGGLIPAFASGGSVRGPGGPRSDSILAKLSRGEYVINAASVQSLGLPFMNAINKMGAKGLSSYLQGKISKNVSAAKNKYTQAKSRILKLRDGGLADGEAAPSSNTSMPNLTINIENKSQARVKAIQPDGPSIQDQVRGIVYNVILEDAAVNGPLTRASGGGL